MLRPVVVGLLALGQVATADPRPKERAVVGAIDVGSTIPAHVAKKAGAQIEHGLAAAGYTLVPASEAGDALATCREAACVKKVGAALRVQAVVVANIARQFDNTVIVMRLFDTSTGNPEAELREVCELCGEAELADRLSVAASALRARAVEERRRRLKLMVKEPPREPVPQRPPPRPERRSVVPGVMVGAAGLGLIAGGIYMFAIDGKGTCSPGDTPVFPDPGAVIRYPDEGNRDIYVCRDVYKTRTLGYAGVGVGAIGVILGTALVVRARGSHRTVEVVPAVGGATVKVSLPW